jgi:hypothetical protein
MTATATEGPRSPALAGASRVLIGIGAQKAGTTWVFEQLARHPEVHLARPKELHYWDTIRAPFAERYRTLAVARGRAIREAGRLERLSWRLRAMLKPALRKRRAEILAYERLLTGDPFDHAGYTAYLAAGRRGQAVVGDITPRYAMLGAESFAEIAALHPDVRFLYLLRDPVDRLWSGVRHRHRGLMKGGRIDGAGLDRAFAAALSDPWHPDRRHSDYAATLAPLESVVPPERILCLFFETMFEPGGLAPLAAHLGIGPIDQRPEETVNAGVATTHRLSPGLRAEARTVLAPVYDAMEARFGDRLPARWRARTTPAPGAGA